MSTQPMPASPPIRKEEQERIRRRSEDRSDLLYFAGAALVTAGVGMIRIRYGLIAAGTFLLFLPLLELATSFIRGLRGRGNS